MRLLGPIKRVQSFVLVQFARGRRSRDNTAAFVDQAVRHLEELGLRELLKVAGAVVVV